MVAFWTISFLTVPFEYLLLDKPFYQQYLIISTLVILFIMFAWFVTDAKETGIKPSIWLKIGVIFIALIFIPYYLVKYKGWNRSYKSFALFFAFAIPLFLYDLLLEYCYYNI